MQRYNLFPMKNASVIWKEIKDRETKREAIDMIQEKETITSNLAVVWDGWENVEQAVFERIGDFFFFFFFPSSRF